MGAPAATTLTLLPDLLPAETRSHPVPLIELRDIWKIYDLGEVQVEALKQANLTIDRGEYVSLIGPSGSGKSTLMNTLGCLDRPTRGSYKLAGEEVATMSRDERARLRNQRLGFVFQNFNLLARTSALENVELPAAGGRYRKAFTQLLVEPPAHISVERWQRAIEDGRSFLAAWGEQADALGWDSRDLFGLDIPPDDPHPSYSRLSRYDNTGLCWLLQGKEVIAMTADTVTIRNPSTGAITIYRRFNKPALGPVGDSLDDLK